MGDFEDAESIPVCAVQFSQQGDEEGKGHVLDEVELAACADV